MVSSMSRFSLYRDLLAVDSESYWVGTFHLIFYITRSLAYFYESSCIFETLYQVFQKCHYQLRLACSPLGPLSQLFPLKASTAFYVPRLPYRILLTSPELVLSTTGFVRVCEVCFIIIFSESNIIQEWVISISCHHLFSNRRAFDELVEKIKRVYCSSKVLICGTDESYIRIEIVPEDIPNNRNKGVSLDLNEINFSNLKVASLFIFHIPMSRINTDQFFKPGHKHALDFYFLPNYF